MGSLTTCCDCVERLIAALKAGDFDACVDQAQECVDGVFDFLRGLRGSQGVACADGDRQRLTALRDELAACRGLAAGAPNWLNVLKIVANLVLAALDQILAQPA